MKKTGYIFHNHYLLHDTQRHPENAGRLRAIEEKLEHADIRPHLKFPEIRPATEEEIALVHEPGYIDSVRTACAEGARFLDADTAISAQSYEAARLSAGAGITAVDRILDGDCDNVFCAVRPPGHHAENARAMGFCLFNNVAIAAQYARLKKGLNRVFIFDWDVHHGNGTQNSFYTDPTVFYSSTHQYPFYPGTGAADETGSGDGLGATLNFPLRAHNGDAQYLDIVENKLLPAMYKFKPDLVILSAGFDAHADDPLAQMEVSTECYGEMTALIARAAGELCHGRIISMLEGGYNPDALADSVYIHLKNLLL
jgi:acetoin utilization deacetylase AcuC-like enzyme